MALINRVSMLNRCMSASYKHTRTFSVTSQHHNADTIGFVGLGNMGAHMARNLIKTGHSILVYDLNTDITKSLKKEGASVAVSAAEVAAETKTIVSMLPSSPHVKEVYLGDNGIFSFVKSGSLLIDSSTIDPAVSRDMAIHAQQKGVSFFDAPVSGGVNAAREGTLTFMVGGPEKAFPQVEAILKHMGKNVVHCGNVGTGQAAKICNNMLLGISMIGTAETMNLGIKLGLDPKLLAKILNMSSGRCWSSELYNPCPGVLENVPSSNNYQGGFGTALMTKDLGLAQNAATMALSPTPLGSAAHQLYRIMCNSGYSAKDFSSAFLFLQELNKKE